MSDDTEGTSRPIDASGPAHAEPAPAWAEQLRPKAPRRLHPATIVLAVVLLLAVGFAGGIAVQRAQQPATTSARGFGGFGGRGPGGFPTGGFPTGGATPGGRGGFGGAFGTPVASGTVTAVDASTVTIKADDGSSVTVHVSSTTTISVRGATSLQTGAQVQVLGTKGSDGSVDATAIVTRRQSA